MLADLQKRSGKTLRDVYGSVAASWEMFLKLKSHICCLGAGGLSAVCSAKPSLPSPAEKLGTLILRLLPYCWSDAKNLNVMLQILHWMRPYISSEAAPSTERRIYDSGHVPV